MSTNFPLSDLSDIDGAIQEGRGAAAATIGQSYDVRRLTTTTAGSITNEVPLYTNFPAIIRKAQKKQIENTTFDLQVFEATCDNTYLQLGDVLTETGYRNDSGMYTVAQMRPLRPTLIVRTEAAITITRPRPKGGRASQQPAQGAVLAPGYLGTGKKNEWPLTLVDGLYSFEPSGSAAVVPCGLQPLNRVRDGSKNDAAGQMPTSLYREHFLAWLPLIPGDQLQELDRLNFPNADRYEIALLYTSETTGLSGHVLVVEKLST